MALGAEGLLESAWEYVLGSEERRSMLGYDYLVKLLLIGDSGVGKSSMLLRVTSGAPPPSGNGERPLEGLPPPCPTVGVDYRSLSLPLENKIAKVQIWDTAGHERFRSVTRAYFRSAMGVMLVFDVSSKASFLSMDYWLSMMRETASPHVQLLLVGNKCDMAGRQVTRGEAEALAARCGSSYIETSAATGERLHAAFLCLTQKVICYIEEVERGLRGSSSSSSEERGLLPPRAGGPHHPVSGGVNEALRGGDLDLVAGISLLQRPSPPHTERQLARRRYRMQFRRYPIDDALDSLCDV
ncbi:hypothetical protein Efla_003825 [Eimeria flavescens]